MKKAVFSKSEIKAHYEYRESQISKNIDKKFFKRSYKEILFLWTLYILVLMVWNFYLWINTTNANIDILNETNLSDCRMVQDENSHIKKGNGSMYAYDIACIRWQSFEVKTPNFKKEYVVKYIWYDKRIGNYITIKHWNLYFIYWHTTTTLKVWDRLKNNTVIGKTDVSWVSQNYHLHLELWLDKENISFEYFNWDIIKAEKSFKIREQRGWITDLEMNIEIQQFIEKHEWLELKAYWDINHWSIWVWTPSYKWEVINIEEARKRSRVRIQRDVEKYNLRQYPLNVQKAVASFIYNIWSLNNDQQRKLENWFYSALWNDFKQYNWYYKNWKKIVLSWLEKRRSDEDKQLKL